MLAQHQFHIDQQKITWAERALADSEVTFSLITSNMVAYKITQSVLCIFFFLLSLYEIC